MFTQRWICFWCCGGRHLPPTETTLCITWQWSLCGWQHSPPGGIWCLVTQQMLEKHHKRPFPKFEHYEYYHKWWYWDGIVDDYFAVLMLVWSNNHLIFQHWSFQQVNHLFSHNFSRFSLNLCEFGWRKLIVNQTNYEKNNAKRIRSTTIHFNWIFYFGNGANAAVDQIISVPLI